MPRRLDRFSRVWRDEDLPAFVSGLGLDGIVDLHVHFMPERVQAKVWAYFDAARTQFGVDWPIVYRGSAHERLTTLRTLGVRRFTALLYPHKPGMAAWLNDWAAEWAPGVPEVLHTATAYPEPQAPAYVEKALVAGARVMKLHVQVGGYDPSDPLLERVWGLLADAGTPIVLHAGSGPVPGRHTGPGPIAAVLARHPTLRLVVAHMGAPEYAEFLDLAEHYENVGLDTTMTFTEMLAPYPPDLLPRVRAAGLSGKVFFGSDFPNIPYPYAHAVEALDRLELGAEWLRAVLHDNATRLLDLT